MTVFYLGLFMTKISVATVAKAMLNDAVIQMKKGKDAHPHSHILSNHQINDLVRKPKDQTETKKETAEASTTTPAKEEPQPVKDEEPQPVKEEQPEGDKVEEPETTTSADASDKTEPQPDAADEVKDQTQDSETPTVKDEEDKAT